MSDYEENLSAVKRERDEELRSRFSKIELATMDYLEALHSEFGEGAIEISLPRGAYRGLLNSLLMDPDRDRQVYRYEYNHFTWNTMAGPVVVRMLP